MEKLQHIVGAKKPKNGHIERIRTVSLYPCHPLLPGDTAQCQGEPFSLRFLQWGKVRVCELRSTFPSHVGCFPRGWPLSHCIQNTEVSYRAEGWGEAGSIETRAQKV